MALKRLIGLGLVGLLLSFTFPAHAQQDTGTITLGTGLVDSLFASPDGHWLLIATSAGTYLQDTTHLETPPKPLIGHGDMVWYASFSPDSRIVATASPDNTVRLWDTATANPLDTLSFSDTPRAPVFNADGTLLFVATGTESPGTYYLVDLTNHQQIVLPGLAAQLIFTGDGALAVSGFLSRDMATLSHYHRGANGFTQQDQPLPAESLAGLSDDLLSANFSPDGVFLAIEDTNAVGHVANILDVASGRLISQITGTTGITSFTADSRHLAVSTGDGLLLLDVPEDTRFLLPMQADSSPHLSDHWLLYTNPLGKVVLRDLITGKEVTLEGDLPPVWQFEVGDAGVFVFSQQNLYHFDAVTGALLETVPINLPPLRSGDRLAYSSASRLTVLNLASGQVLGQAENAGYGYNRLLFAGQDALFYISASTQVTRLNLTDQSTQNVLLPSLGSDISDVAYSPDGQSLAFSVGSSIRIVNPATGAVVQTLDSNRGMGKISFTPDGSRLLTFSNGAGLQVWDIGAGTLQTTLNPGVGIQVNDFALSPDGQTVAISSPRVVSLINLQGAMTGNPALTTLATDLPSYERSLTFSPDGRWLAAGYDLQSESDGSDSLFLFDVARQTVRPVKSDPYSYPVSIAFSPDSQLLAAAGGNLTLWSVSKPQEPLYVIPGGSLASVAFSPDGQWLISTEFYSIYARRTFIYRAEDGFLRAVWQRAATPQGGGGGGDSLPSVPLAASPISNQFATVDRGAVLVLRSLADLSPEDGAVPIVAYCDGLPGKPASPRSDQSVSIVWSWYAQTLPEVLDHLRAASYDIRLDGTPQYTANILPEAIHRDPANNNNWTVYYRIYPSPLASGQHTITYRVTWREKISDGFEDYGPDTATPEETGSCTFTVQ